MVASFSLNVVGKWGKPSMSLMLGEGLPTCLVKLKGVNWHQISVGVVTSLVTQICWFILVMIEG